MFVEIADIKNVAKNLDMNLIAKMKENALFTIRFLKKMMSNNIVSRKDVL